MTITATDSSGGNGSFTSTGAASISIGAPTITINPATLPNAENGVSYGATLSTTGGIAPFTFGLTAGSLPDGLALAADGTISGTPTGGGTYHFTVTASDSAGTGPYTGARAYALIVDTPTIVLSPSAGALPGGTTGLAYSQSFGASGGTGPYTYSVTGTLPTGLSLSSAGVLSGTPTAGGTFTFTVSATDSATGTGPFTAAQNYSLTIAAPTIAVAPSALPKAAFGAAYSQTVTASGGIAPYSYSVTSGTLPQGLNLSAAGVLSGTPTEVGTFNITISATDAATGTGPSRARKATLLSSTRSCRSPMPSPRQSRPTPRPTGSRLRSPGVPPTASRSQTLPPTARRRRPARTSPTHRRAAIPGRTASPIPPPMLPEPLRPPRSRSR